MSSTPASSRVSAQSIPLDGDGELARVGDHLVERLGDDWDDRRASGRDRGRGFGGLFAAKFLRRAPVEVRLVDRTNHHLFQPLLYQVATGILSPGEIKPATRDVLRKHTNVSVELGEVTGFDLEARRVSAVRPDESQVSTPYDSLIVAAGVGQLVFRQRSVRTVGARDEVASPMHSSIEAGFRGVRDGRAEEDPEARRAWLTFVVVGGGPTGVEIAGQIAEPARRALRQLQADRPGRRAGFSSTAARRSRRPPATGYPRWEPVRAHVRRRDPRPVDRDRCGRRRCRRQGSGRADRGATWPRRRSGAGGSISACEAAGPTRAAPSATAPAASRCFPDCSPPAIRGLRRRRHDELGRSPGVAEVAMQSGIHAARTIKKRLNTARGSPVQVPRCR